MIKIDKTKINEQKIPSGIGIFTLSDENDILYISKTMSLDKSIRQLLRIAKDDKNIFQLISQTKTISYEEHDSLFSALVHQKKLQSKHLPEFSFLIKPYDQYVYLGIDFDNPQYFKVVEDTQQKRFYIGPFKDRFFLFDLLDIMAELFQSPLCPIEAPYPCERYKNEKCPGWCIKERHDTYQKAILPVIIPDEELFFSKQNEYNKLYDDLQFAKAEDLKRKIQVFEKYREYLKFYYVTKNLDLEITEDKKQFIFKSGKLSKIIENGETTELPVTTIEYRDNELLAFNKDELAERWIIYNYLLKKNEKIILDRINTFYKKSLLKIRSHLT